MSKTILKFFRVAGIAILFMSCSSNKGIKRVWAIDDSEKIKKEDIENPLASDENNAVWKNNTVNIFGARNEIVAFQLIIQADTGGAKNVNVSVSDLKNGKAIIPGSASGTADPFDYRGRNIELFTEHYLNITDRTPPLWLFAKSAAPSDYYTGWVPDCLVPFSAPSGKGGAPFSIDANNNQGVWVDIFIPRVTPSGIYTGKVSVSVSDKIYTDIPINLKVYGFTLPDTTHIKNMFMLNPQEVAGRHGVVEGSMDYYDLEAKYHQLAHRHRFNIVRTVSNLTDMSDFHKRYLTGELYNKRFGYDGPGENVGNNTFSIGLYGSFPKEYGGSVTKMNKADWWAGSDAWVNWFKINAPGVAYHKYLFPDEPDFQGPAGAKGTGSLDTIRLQAEWTHSNPGPGKNIPAFVTNVIKPGLSGYVDFWSVSGKETTEKVTKEEFTSEKALGKKFGIYNGYRPGMGATVLDGDAIEFRVMPWIVWKYNIDQYFNWSINYWTHLNVFSNPLTFNNKVNGGGVLLYPGQDKAFPDEDRNLSGPLSSIRAKNWRRGAQDYEYLWLAKQAGLETQVKPILDSCVPKALWDAKNQKDISWSSHGYKFDHYRKQLAELLSGKSIGD